MFNQEENYLLDQNDNIVENIFINNNQLSGFTFFDLECILITNNKLFQIFNLSANIFILAIYINYYLIQQFNSKLLYLNNTNLVNKNLYLNDNFYHRYLYNCCDESFILITIYCCLILPYLITKLLLYYKFKFVLAIRTNTLFDESLIRNVHNSIANLKICSKIVNLLQSICFFFIIRAIYFDKINDKLLTLIFRFFIIQELFPIIIIFLIIYINPSFNNQSLYLFFNNFISIIDIINFILCNQTRPFYYGRLSKKEKLDIIKKKINDISKNNIDFVKQSCSICLEEYEQKNRKKIVELPCKHIYHKRCLLKWMNIKTTCPICRFNLLEQ